MLESDKHPDNLAYTRSFIGYASCRRWFAEEPVHKLTSAISSVVFNPAPYNELAIVIDVTAAVKTRRRTF